MERKSNKKQVGLEAPLPLDNRTSIEGDGLMLLHSGMGCYAGSYKEMGVLIDFDLKTIALTSHGVNTASTFEDLKTVEDIIAILDRLYQKVDKRSKQ